jgi:hypothetical protein
MCRLSRQCGILNISQPYRPPRPVKGIALLLELKVTKTKKPITEWSGELHLTDGAALLNVEASPMKCGISCLTFCLTPTVVSETWFACMRIVLAGPETRRAFFSLRRSHQSHPTRCHIITVRDTASWMPLWSSGQSPWLQIERSEFDSRRYQIFWEVVGLELGPFNLVSTNEELLFFLTLSFAIRITQIV